MLNAQDEDVWSKMRQVMSSLSYLCIPLLVCMTACREQEVGRRVIRMLREDDMTPHDAEIIRSIREIADRKETACFFGLDHQLILPFAGHIISFSVIFMQLMPSK